MSACPPGTEVSAEGLEQYRPELWGHCWQILGLVADADDAVQETMVRAWRGAGGFEGRSTVRSWLYRIATNVCLDMLRVRKRREQPIEPEPDRPWTAGAAQPMVAGGTGWLTLVAEDVPSAASDPAELTASRDTVRLAFATAIQYLPVR